MTVCRSLYRGVFGSPAVTIPNVPKIDQTTPKIDVHPDAFVQGEGHLHDMCPIRGQLRIKLDAAPTGYLRNLTTDDFYLGVWRKFARNDAPMLASSTTTTTLDESDLIHHADGRNRDNTQQECGICDSDHGLSIDPETNEIIYDDVFYLPWSGGNTPTYDGRIYLKVPQEMLRTDVKYMAVDPKFEDGPGVISAIHQAHEDIVNDASAVVWFDMQGRRIATPREGEVYLKISRNGAVKTIYNPNAN